MRAFVFPGQGKSVSIGMGKSLALAFKEAKDAFDEVDDALNQHLSRLMWEGPEEELVLTENAQPALMAVGVALTRVLEKQSGCSLAEKSAFSAGHSLGEYSALTAFKMFRLDDAARILKKRGQAMQNAVAPGIGAMAALLGADIQLAQEIAQKASKLGVCEPSNDNAPNQVVLSGHKEAIDKAIEIASEMGVKRAILLPVSAPFHCSLMAPAAHLMQEVLQTIKVQKPISPIISNVTAEVEDDPQKIMTLLVQQITKTVRWRESVKKLQDLGVSEIAEMGSGKVLTGLIKTISPDIKLYSLHEPRDIEFFLENIN